MKMEDRTIIFITSKKENESAVFAEFNKIIQEAKGKETDRSLQIITKADRIGDKTISSLFIDRNIDVKDAKLKKIGDVNITKTNHNTYLKLINIYIK